jgi:hypothetical protein
MRTRILFALIFFALLADADAQQPRRDDSAQSIAGLRQITAELDAAVRRLNSDLDREVAMHDHGYRSKTGRRIPAADNDLITGQANVVRTAMRKLVAARRPGYRPAALTDIEQIQALIAEARNRIDAGQ